MQIAVIGAGTCTADEGAAAYNIGALLAKNQATLVCGGMGGVMEAACRGAYENGGQAVGIVPDESDGNPFLSIVIRTGLGHARNVLVVQSADAVIAVGGRFGTLSEIAVALKTGRPVFGYRTWDIAGVEGCSTAEEAAIRAVSAASRSPLYRSRQGGKGSP